MFIELTELGRSDKITVNIAHIVTVTSRPSRGGQTAGLDLINGGGKELAVQETYDQVINLIRQAGSRVI
jgi:uncharacterized protein YlzI (FlbEa/FlbD family)